MDKKKHLDEFLDLAKTIFIETKKFYNEQYPGVPEVAKMIPVTLFACKVWENYWGAKFHGKMSKVQHKGMVESAQEILKNMGVGS